MNVCVVAEYYPRRREPALGVWAHEQAVAARDAGASVRVLALERPLPPASALRRPGRLAASVRALARQPGREVRDGIEVEYVRFAAPPRPLGYISWDAWVRGPLARALSRLDRERRVDLVHAHYALPAGAATLPWARMHGRPLVVSLHGGDLLGPLFQAPAARARVADVLRSADAVLCNSRGTLTRARALAGPRVRGRVVRLGARAPDHPPARRDEPAVATLAHLVGRKRHEDVLQALALLAGGGSAPRWVVIGDGPERPRLERMALELGIEDRVEWLGELTPRDAVRELARCHLMALPSEDEAFGVAYAEALACGVPAVGCRGEDGPEDIAAAGEGMVLVPPRDPPALAETLAGLLADRGRLDALAAAARATAEREFGWERCGRETVAAYREVHHP